MLLGFFCLLVCTFRLQTVINKNTSLYQTALSTHTIYALPVIPVEMQLL